jgi:hypothetical protein
MRARRHVVACLVGSYLLATGFLVGMMVSAMRFDGQRAAILSKLEDASTRVRAELMLLDGDAARTAVNR